MADKAEREKLILDNIPLVGFLASKCHAQVTNFPREELVSAGTLALVRAADRYDPALGVPFGAYAARRIRGAFSDEMRSQDWATRSVRSGISEVEAAQQQLRIALDREPTNDEIAQATGLSLAKVLESIEHASRVVMDIDDERVRAPHSHAPGPESSAEEQEEYDLLHSAIEALPERMRLIVRAVYFDDKSVTELAAELGVGHSAVSQQRSEALRMLRDAMDRVFVETAAQAPVSTSDRMREKFFDRMTVSAPRFARAFA